MRTNKRKIEKGKTPADTTQRAIRLVLNEGMAGNNIAKHFLIPQKTLHRYVVKAKSQKENNGEINLKRVGYFNWRNIFSKEQETVLADYL
ncbi:hypothetical protein NQ314_005683 [Rhamnusium bicolor]|uniref:HTH psq-type domain-containing protein n=1 Tax=Rhamnusium bicolor TaxID=1586634 RepID=A0AAV8ZEZ6_9CUCU|nr:hypothetical protein NQ314_005683 [Rhamnusium bicolor]